MTASVWSDAGDLIDTVTNARVFPIKQQDTMTKVELQDAYDNYLSDVASTYLIERQTSQVNRSSCKKGWSACRADVYIAYV